MTYIFISLLGKDFELSETLDEIYDALYEELNDPATNSIRLDEIASEHIQDNFNCEVCQIFRDEYLDISSMISGHNNCKESTLDKLMNWSQTTGDPGSEVDILIAACKRSRNSFNGKWFDYVLDSGWSYRLQFESGLHYHFIRVLMDSRDLTEDEKRRMVDANDGMESFPTIEELQVMGF